MDKIYILNGATGTELMKMGYTGMNEAQWILDNKDKFQSLENAYIEAGSDVLYTPTFGMNRAKLKLEGNDNQTEYFNIEMTKLVKENKAIIWGNLGPSGLFAEPMGEATEEELYEIYKEQAMILEKAGVDALIVETMMTLEDTLAAVKACKDNTKLPIYVSCTCNENGRLLTGTDVIDVLKQVESFGIVSFGLNCSTGPKAMLEQIKRIHNETNLPLLVKPNAGLPVQRDGNTIYDCDPEEFASYAKDFIENGVRFIGGCCGTTPEHIKALKNALKDYLD